MGLRQIPSLSLAGFAFDSTRSYYYLYMVIVIILMALSLKLINSRWGRAFLACRDNESAVESCGINIVATKLTAFTLCTVYGCIAGSLYAHLMRYINPMTYTFDLSAKFLMMIMLGGLGSSYGLVFGAFIVTALSLIQISERTRRTRSAYVVVCYKQRIQHQRWRLGRCLLQRNGQG